MDNNIIALYKKINEKKGINHNICREEIHYFIQHIKYISQNSYLRNIFISSSIMYPFWFINREFLYETRGIYFIELKEWDSWNNKHNYRQINQKEKILGLIICNKKCGIYLPDELIYQLIYIEHLG